MGVSRCACGTYVEGEVCSVCGREATTVATVTTDAGRPWELGDVEGEATATDEPAGVRWPEAEPTWKPTNPWAVVALALGLLGGSLLAIIFGLVAVHQIDEHEREGGRSVAVAGITLGVIWIVVVVVVLLNHAG